MIGCKSDINVRDSNVPKANCSSVGPLHFLIASGNMLKKHKAKTKMAKTEPSKAETFVLLCNTKAQKYVGY